MYRHDAEEAAKVVNAALASLIGFGPRRGLEGADMRAAIGRIQADAAVMLQEDAINPDLMLCFDLASAAGVTRAQFGQVRRIVSETTPATTDAVGIKHALILLCLLFEARLLSRITFGSRNETEALKAELNTAFSQAADDAAEAMDSATYRAIVELHAAVSFFLIEAGRPLARMLRYQFAMPQPTLVLAHRLYGDAGRADQIRIENKIIHPAFAPRAGRALSA